ncbi:MAG: PhoH family protein [Candidatus Marinimicrobia bacterium]|nr:PhoH family protein [Candidatus Neomarinimicrobiota bacterium]
MTNTKREIIMKGFDPIALLGVRDENLKVLRKHFNATITARGERLIIDGEFEVVEQIHHILNEMIHLIPKRKQLDATDVSTIINMETDHNEKVYSGPDDSIILFTHKGIIKPRTAGQEAYFRASLENDITFAIGPAGTGKTYQAVAVAVAALKNHEISRIILTRPAVEAGERLGFLPGDMKDKIDPYLAPLYDAMRSMIAPEKFKAYLEQHVVEIVPLAYMRGRTLDNAYLILDEAQNTTDLQMKMFLTRIGVNSKAFITGDITQIDLPYNQRSGLCTAIDILRDIEGIAVCELKTVDVVRHPLVKKIIDAYDGNGKEKEKTDM